MKYLTAVAQPAFWPAIARGVMPTVEHVEALRMLNPRTVIDVGCEQGTVFARCASSVPDRTDLCVEPLASERRLYKAVVAGPVRMHAPWLWGRRKATRPFL